MPTVGACTSAKIKHSLYFCNCRLTLGRGDLPMRANASPVLIVASLGHALVAFVNGEYVGKHTQMYPFSETQMCSIFLADYACVFKEMDMGAI